MGNNRGGMSSRQPQTLLRLMGVLSVFLLILSTSVVSKEKQSAASEAGEGIPEQTKQKIPEQGNGQGQSQQLEGQGQQEEPQHEKQKPVLMVAVLRYGERQKITKRTYQGIKNLGTLFHQTYLSSKSVNNPAPKSYIRTWDNTNALLAAYSWAQGLTESPQNLDANMQTSQRSTLVAVQDAGSDLLLVDRNVPKEGFGRRIDIRKQETDLGFSKSLHTQAVGLLAEISEVIKLRLAGEDENILFYGYILPEGSYLNFLGRLQVFNQGLAHEDNPQDTIEQEKIAVLFVSLHAKSPGADHLKIQLWQETYGIDERTQSSVTSIRKSEVSEFDLLTFRKLLAPSKLLQNTTPQFDHEGSEDPWWTGPAGILTLAAVILAFRLKHYNEIIRTAKHKPTTATT